MKTLRIMEMMERLMRICPEVKLVPGSDMDSWEVVLPKTASLIKNDADELSAPFIEKFTGITFDTAIKFTWEKLITGNRIILIDGYLPWESIAVVKWNSELDDWENHYEPEIPPMKKAHYKLKGKKKQC